MEMKEALDALASLSHEVRLKVFRLLVAASPHGLPAGTISEELGIPANTLSFHLNHLRHAGLVSSKRRGRLVITVAHCEQVQLLTDYLTAHCCTRPTCGEDGA